MAQFVTMVIVKKISMDVYLTPTVPTNQIRAVALDSDRVKDPL